MKKSALLLILVAFIGATFGQKSKLTSAITYFKEGNLIDAKDRIDATVNNESTVGLAKTWYFRGEIYRAIANSKNTEIKALHKMPLKEAYDAYSKCLELDEKGKFEKKAPAGQRAIFRVAYNGGLEAYQAGRDTADVLVKTALLEKAISQLGFCQGLKGAEKKYVHTAMRLAAKSCFLIGKYQDAADRYEALMTSEFRKINYLYGLMESYDSLGKVESSIASIEQHMNSTYKESADTLISLTEMIVPLYAKANAIKSKTEKVANMDDPNHFLLGLLHLYGYIDTARTYEERNKSLVDCQEAFKAEIAKTPNHASALYQYARINHSQGVFYLDDAEKAYMKGKDAKGADLKAKGDEFFKKAEATFEKHIEIERDQARLNEAYTKLKQIYLKSNQFDKVKAIDARMKAQ